MINQKKHQHAFDYLLLFSAGVVFLIAAHIFQGERFTEFILLSIFTSFYILWGWYHHIIEDTVHLKTMLEYIFIGFIVLFLIKILILL